jgi:hypothetical protein
MEWEARGMIGPAAIALRSPHVRLFSILPAAEKNGAKFLICGEGTELELNPEF